MNENNLRMYSPWVVFYKEVEALFKKDPDVEVSYNDEDKTITLRVEGSEKANALMAIMPKARTFGNVTVKVRVVPANADAPTMMSMYEAAFKGNPAVAFTQNAQKGIYSFNYVVFAKEVVQYATDDLSDINGLRSTLYEDIARELFGSDDCIFFCTDTKS